MKNVMSDIHAASATSKLSFCLHSCFTNNLLQKALSYIYKFATFPQGH